MPESWLLPGGTNLFQDIKKACTEAEISGQKLYRLSIGQPSGPALMSARVEASRCVLCKDECWHEYQDNGCLPIPDFAKRFVEAHLHHHRDLSVFGDQIAFLPIPGIKPMIPLVLLACKKASGLLVGSMTDPGYPVPRTWAEYLGVEHCSLLTNTANGFCPPIDIGPFTLKMVNFPHNPSGQIATREYWRKLCGRCQETGVRLFNDGAYLLLAHDDRCCALADVAVEFPRLSWLEAYSASKAIANGTGWRVGAMAGSSDFIADVARIKGNTDSGFFAPAASGALYALENDLSGIGEVRKMYSDRLGILIPLLERLEMRLAVRPKAGFFSLWESPKFAFGREMTGAEDFNLTMIRETGIVGVHFGSYIRYAVCGPVENWREQISEAFASADVSY